MNHSTLYEQTNGDICRLYNSDEMFATWTDEKLSIKESDTYSIAMYISYDSSPGLKTSLVYT